MSSTDHPTVWIVDDSNVQAGACKHALCDEHRVTVFLDGATMLEALAVGPAPDLLIIDWHMPEMSGLDVLVAIRAAFPIASLPVIVVTGEREQEALLAALDAGANDFVHKPYRDLELRARVATLLRSKRLHDKLKETEQQLREEAMIRERFMGVLAHDLRQPLNTLSLGASAMLKLPEEARAGVAARMASAILRMSRLIEQVLDVSRLQSTGALPITLGGVDLEQLVVRVTEEFRASNARRPIDLTVRGDCVGVWDADRLGQVCANLIGNAVSHGTPKEPITIALTGGEEGVELLVSNPGVAIAPPLLASIFEPFRQGETPSPAGVGLGLYIVKEIVEAHGGTVHVASDDRTTAFTVRLPREARLRPAQAPAAGGP